MTSASRSDDQGKADTSAPVIWRIDKASRMPLYVQLRDLIRMHLATGHLAPNERLPGVVELGRILDVNFETVRKAYKELEREGLVRIRRGRGTVVTGLALPVSANAAPADVKDALRARALQFIAALVADGIDVSVARQAIDEAFVGFTHRLIFTECNEQQIRDISEVLRTHLQVGVDGVLLSDLREAVLRASLGGVAAVVTTGFHVLGVREILAGLDVPIHFVIVNMSAETRRKVLALEGQVRFGFLCRDNDYVAFFREMVAAELGLTSDIPGCALTETDEVQRLIGSVDAILASRAILDQVRALVPPHMPVFNVLDRVDPMSMRALKELVFGGAESAVRSLGTVDPSHT